ncbi:uncharacterized protein SPPG_00374 [Spizellomyces punctatus DAOM BR117]|uniref:RGS domain-containing protein n=1 Tax=Spizellomyces punctatus (strain DAOM BR117) TaxID=645134 RepID=A0A0L0HU78_SPIPD|nr:uncharacterized protein SPPG_00374 [Spizellomyces punctatus DAOM BR117]KND04658.1 hypothetical protein SPPG_00374 [Spizellomyces punctatus DAOM BR117]|eukprot:XP_016612697.1 hypothetical protein SPPG_00374 [Spizellomyces punctatus DAOM BR117]
MIMFKSSPEEPPVTLKAVLSGQTCPPISYTDFAQYMNREGQGQYIEFYEAVLGYVLLYRQWSAGQIEREHQARVAERARKEKENREAREREREKEKGKDTECLSEEGRLCALTESDVENASGEKPSSSNTLPAAQSNIALEQSDWGTYMNVIQGRRSTSAGTDQTAVRGPFPSKTEKKESIKLENMPIDSLHEALDTKARLIFDTFLRQDSPSVVPIPEELRTFLQSHICVPPPTYQPHSPSLLHPTFNHVITQLSQTHFPKFLHQATRYNLSSGGIARRILLFCTSAFITVASLLINIYLKHSPYLRLLMAIPIYFMIIGVWQAKAKFCVLFARLGRREDAGGDMFSWMADNLPVVDPVVLRMQRRRARKVSTLTQLAAILCSVILLVAVPSQIHPEYRWVWSR